jgi:hypothetical protein
VLYGGGGLSDGFCHDEMVFATIYDIKAKSVVEAYGLFIN